MSGIIDCGGQAILLGDGVDCVYDEKLDFPYAKPRSIAPDLIVIHNTAGEGSGRQIHRTLFAKRLSIHFAVDRAGVIWQYCDPATVSCAHVGKGVNSRSIGIEVANAIFPPPPPGVKPGYFATLFSNVKKYAITGKEKLLGRPTVNDGYRGGKRRVLGHFPAQITATRALVRALLVAFPTIPPKLPRGVGGKVHGEWLPPGWKGVAGHLNFTDAHVDPAMDLLYPLEADLS